MSFNDKPFEHLVTNAITFVAGALTALGLSAYIREVEQRTREEERERQHTETDTPPTSDTPTE